MVTVDVRFELRGGPDKEAQAAHMEYLRLAFEGKTEEIQHAYATRHSNKAFSKALLRELHAWLSKIQHHTENQWWRLGRICVCSMTVLLSNARGETILAVNVVDKFVEWHTE